jgi:hypothetical protein
MTWYSLLPIQKISSLLINGSRLALCLLHFSLLLRLSVWRTVSNKADSREDIFMSRGRFHIFKKKKHRKM